MKQEGVIKFALKHRAIELPTWTGATLRVLAAWRSILRSLELIGQDGKRYEFKVPVRSKVASDIKGKTVLFVIMQDHVEGFVSTPLPNFKDKLDRFY